MFGNPSDLAFHQSNDDDPYISLTKIEEDEERQELEILPQDNLLVVAKTEDDVSYLEVHVYEDASDNLYVHHDVMLPSYPICVECMDFRAATGDHTTPGNFAAVGMIEPDIEIWDLDTVDAIYPNAVLGRSKEKRKKRKKRSEKYHVDAVLCLAWSPQHRSLLASGSADHTIKLWDLATLTCAQSYAYHKDKVSTLAWSFVEPTVLLSGGYDQRVVMADMRAPEGEMTQWELPSDIESVKWDPHRPDHFFATSDDGMIRLFDSRGGSESKAVWQLHAHDGAVAAFAVNPTIPGFLASASSDSIVKIWNVQAEGPSMVASQDLGTGKHFSLNFAPDAEVAFRLAVAGSGGVAQVWDTSINPMIRKTFAAKGRDVPADAKTM